jgi:FlaG/FlaF family flagellin (archaellin)
MKKWGIVGFSIALLAGCITPNQAVTASASQLQTRQYQTKEYSGLDKKNAIKALISTLQDVDFVLDKVDPGSGTITATKYSSGISQVTATVREKGKDTVSIRINATYHGRVITEPLHYQNLFTLLDKSIFLIKNKID